MDGILAKKTIASDALELATKTNNIDRVGLRRRGERAGGGRIIANVAVLLRLFATRLGRRGSSSIDRWLCRLYVSLAKLDAVLRIALDVRLGGRPDDAEDAELVGSRPVDVIVLPDVVLLDELDLDARLRDGLGPLLALALGGNVKVGEAEGSVELPIHGKDGGILVGTEVANQLEALGGEGVGVLIVPHPLQPVLALLEVVGQSSLEEGRRWRRSCGRRCRSFRSSSCYIARFGLGLPILGLAGIFLLLFRLCFSGGGGRNPHIALLGAIVVGIVTSACACIGFAVLNSSSRWGSGTALLLVTIVNVNVNLLVITTIGLIDVHLIGRRGCTLVTDLPLRSRRGRTSILVVCRIGDGSSTTIPDLRLLLSILLLGGISTDADADANASTGLLHLDVARLPIIALGHLGSAGICRAISTPVPARIFHANSLHANSLDAGSLVLRRDCGSGHGRSSRGS
mmetsp:Transcript_31653/g.92815  ORF Transcript_31653/g.92815 Transcript_31653/m.92815 type:complete len:457 (-) Transcript_31653:257-1627(-)